MIDDKKLHVCVVGPGKRFLSGISYYTLHLVNALTQSNQVSVLLMRQLLPTVFYPGRKRVGANLTRLEYDPSVSVFDGLDWYWLPSMFRALAFLVQERPDEVVLQWWTGTVLHSYLLITLTARLLKSKVVIEFHEVLDTSEARLPIAQMYVRLLAPLIVSLTHGFVIHSEYDRELLKNHYNIEKRPIALIPHGPYHHYQVVSNEKIYREVPISCCNLLFFGVIRPYKGLEDLITAFNTLPENEIHKYRLTIVGETWEGWELPKDLIDRSKYRARITFVNRYVTDEEVVQFFADADAVVLPYHRSSTSGPLHIAMSCGLPVVVTSVGGLVEAVEGYNGAILIPPENTVALQNALLQVVTLCDRRYSNPRSWEHTTTSYQKLFDAFEESEGSMKSKSKELFLATQYVSVVICAYTEERWQDLMAAVESIQRQTLSPGEVIVVIDHNWPLFERAKMHITRAVVIENGEPKGLSGARNSGIAIAQGGLVAFLDDDATAEPDWLERLTDCCREPKVLGVGGIVEPLWVGICPQWFPKEFYWVIGCTYQKMPDGPTIVRNPFGGCTCMRREVFETVGGFRNGIGRVGMGLLGGEETELCIRAMQYWPDKIFLCEPRAKIYHHVPTHRLSWRYFRERCYAEGLSKAIIAMYVRTKYNLSSEKSYVYKVLPGGIISGIRDAILKHDVNGFLRAGTIIVGLATTITGYVVGSIMHHLTTHESYAVSVSLPTTTTAKGEITYMVLQKHKRDWEELGNLNPLWSILTGHREWDVNEFFMTGEQEIQAVMERAKLMEYPRTREKVLDFGCGVGRLTRVLANYFPQCYGVDISESMITLARELNQSITGCTFYVNSEPHLHMFPDESLDMIYTNIVLQHLPKTQMIESYIAEFTRILKKEGLLVFQLPSYIPFSRRWQIRKRLYRLLRKVGVNEQYIYKRLGLYPMQMSYIATKEVVSFLNARGMRVLEVFSDTAVPPPVRSCTYYVTKQQ